MAYEASEIMTAAALMYKTTELEKIETEGDLQRLITDSKKNLDKFVVFGNSAIKKGFTDLMNPNDKSKVQDMAGGVSAAIGIRKYIGSGAKGLTTYMTGNVWPKEVEKFRVSAFGFEDYNSSDIIVTGNKKKFYGISLKKKRQVKAADPTLINKAFDSLLVGKEFDGLKKSLVKTRIDYFAGLVKEAVKKKIILKKDIKDFDRLDNKELFEAKLRDKTQFDRAYIDTKGYATADDGYLSQDTRDPKSMRFFVNKALSDKKNKLFQSFIKIMNDNIDLFSNGLINIILKVNLFDELEEKDLKGVDFDFSLVTAIGDVRKGLAVISKPTIIPLKTTLCGLKRIEKKFKGKYMIEIDQQKMKTSDAAKLFFQLKRGDLILLDLEIRYKGQFTPQPQFQGSLNPQFKAVLEKECGG